MPMRDPDIRVLCEFYGLDDSKAVGRLLGLARLDRERRRAKGWWQHSPNAGAFAEYIALEDAASHICTWQAQLVPGLFQTAAYTHALGVGQGTGQGTDEIDRWVDVKTKRQERLLGDNPLHVYAVIWEAALRQLVGGREVMSAQLERLLELACLPNVRLQVLPFQAGGHPCMTGPFGIVSFAESEAVDVIYVDTATTTVWVENESDSHAYRRFFERTAGLSLTQQDSVALIDSIRKEM